MHIPSYYQPSPPPQHVYANHSPSPRPNYQYPFSVPPHINSRQSPQFQQSPSRGNHRHNGGTPPFPSRGAHHYPNYHPTQQHQFLHSQVGPQLGPHPQQQQQQQQQQHIPFPPQSAKYNPHQPYSPYHYPSPTAPVFTPSWQNQQSISPMPKQLSMPPPQNIQAFYDPSLASPPGLTQNPQTPVVSTVPSSEDGIKIELPPSTPTPEPPLEPASPESPVISQTRYPPTYSQMGTISTSDTAPPAPPPSSPSSSSHASLARAPGVNPVAQWAIWSRRPEDPSHAPSIIISPRARPPPDVVQQAMDRKTPPPSQPTSPSLSATVPTMEESVVEITIGTAKEEENASTPQLAEDGESPTPSAISPVCPPPDVVQEAVDLEVTLPSRSSSPSQSVTILPAEEGSVEITIRTAMEEEEASTPQPAEDVKSPLPSAPEATAVPPQVPSPPTTVKKSWADLLRPPTSAASSLTSPSSGPATRNSLPTSSVMGFSIPAGSASSNPTVPVSPSKKSELISLLTTGPNSNSTTVGTTIIRPRGIVNSGNMCYANSVLQMLVYCPPFQRLFAELGRVLSGSAVAGSGSGSLVNGSGPSSSSGFPSASGSTSTINGLNGKEKEKDAVGMAPLVEATVEFLREFDDKKPKSKTKLGHSRKGSVLVNGNGNASGVRSKGKEKETFNGVDDDSGCEVDWDACDSFLPTYMYDAMKLKKRFDHMKGGHQEDAEEFFGFYLETLEEELLSLLHAVNRPKSTNTTPVVEEKEEAAPRADDGWMEVGKRNRTVITRTIKATESPITRIFSGRFRTTVRAPGQKESATMDDWNLLRLDIQRDNIHTVQDALSGLSQAQSVQLTQSTRSGVIIEGQQQSLIEILPPILVLQMKRFGYDTTGVAKVGKQVRFGPELEIGHDLMIPAAKKAHPPKYKLFGALYHHGFSASGGHYTLDVLHPNRYPGSVNSKTREGWVRIDDELVSDVRHDDVFGAYERDDARCAYLLFYKRI